MKGRIVGHGEKARYYLDSREVTKEEFDAAFPDQPLALDGECALSHTSPHLSEGLSVHPNQVKEAEESAKRRGVPTQFLPDGRPIMTSRAHQKKYLRAYGFHNRDGGYGD